CRSSWRAPPARRRASPASSARACRAASANPARPRTCSSPCVTCSTAHTDTVSLLDLYALSLKGRRDVPALETDGPDGTTVSLTFGEIDDRSDRLAAVLAARGVSRGDRVAFCLPNRLLVVDLWLALIK